MIDEMTEKPNRGAQSIKLADGGITRIGLKKGSGFFKSLLPFSGDNKYSKQSRSYQYVSKIFDMDFESSELNEARDVLKAWDLGTDFENTSARARHWWMKDGFEMIREQSSINALKMRGSQE